MSLCTVVRASPPPAEPPMITYLLVSALRSLACSYAWVFSATNTVYTYGNCRLASVEFSHPLEGIVAILYVPGELNRRKFPVVYRDYNHIGSTAYGTAEMVLTIEITCHPASTRIEHNDRTRLGRRLMLWGLVDANRDKVRDLLVVYVTQVQFLIANERLPRLLRTGFNTFRRCSECSCITGQERAIGLSHVRAWW